MKFRKTFVWVILLVLLAMAATACASPRKDGRIVRGNPAAPVTIVEFTDFQCPYCAHGARTVSAMMGKCAQRAYLRISRVASSPSISGI